MNRARDTLELRIVRQQGVLQCVLAIAGPRVHHHTGAPC